MSVRWKPMILISVLFVVLAAIGLLAITSTMMTGGADTILPQARAESRAGRYDRAKIHYERALQTDPKNAVIHEELAEMLAAWMERDPAQEPKLRPMWLHALGNAVKYGPSRPGPKRALLAHALRREEPADALHWARELKVLDPDDPDACYVLAAEALDRRPPALDEARSHLATLEAKQADRFRTRWLRARLASESGDEAALNAILAGIAQEGPADDPSDRIARLRLELMDLERPGDLATLPARVETFRKDLDALTRDETSAGRVRLLSGLLEQAQTILAEAARENPAEKPALDRLGAALEEVADATYRKALEASGEVDLRLHMAYAEHLLGRGEHARCLEVVGNALKRPLAAQTVWIPTAMELREVGIKAALADPTDAGRFDKAAPYIKELLASPSERDRAVGHLFQGAIDLERSGLADLSARQAAGQESAVRDPQLAASAIEHLGAAAAGLKDVATAQALYGIAEILIGDRAVGRQYLQNAHRLGQAGLDPRYQVWVAWSMLQAGYPEEAEPIVDRLLGEVEAGTQPSDLAAGLHLLRGEIHQARRTPEALRLARDSYRKAVEAGQPLTPALKLRLAQLDAQLGDADGALRQIEQVRDEAGASAEQLAILTLRERGKPDEATARLAAARRRFPESVELTGLDAAMRLEAGKPEEAEALLAEFLARHPESMELSLLRARILAGPLEKPEAAREILEELAKRSETSVPLVQLALLDLARRDFDGVAKTIARIRARWKEAAAADLLDAQLAFAKGDATASAAFLDAALKKDPNNKVALFWKGQLDDLTGSTAEAQRIFESIVRDRPVKELDEGLPLTAAAEWALASMALQKQDFDGAISRFESLLKNRDSAELQRPIHWKLAAARAARGEVAQARAEIDALLADPKTNADERVQAADFFRAHGLTADAERQLDLVLRDDPAHPGALAYRALMWASNGREAESAAMLRQAIARGKQPVGVYLLLAAIENRAGEDGRSQALATIDAGMKAYPESSQLLRARYELMVLAEDPNAVAYVEERVKAQPDGPARDVLVEVYRQQRQFDKAEEIVANWLKQTPKDSPQAAQLASQLVGLVIASAAKAGQDGDRKTEEEALSRALSLIARFREQYPKSVDFPRYECELASASGDLARANRVAREIAELDKASPLGPMLAARLALAAERFDEAETAYSQALERSPSNDEIRLELGRVQLARGKSDEAVRQASAVLDSQRESVEAALLKAQALAARQGDAAEVEAARVEAARVLQALLQDNPKIPEVYHLLADIRVVQGRRDLAVQTLDAGLKAVPDDDAGVSLMVQRLAEGHDEAGAKAVAERFGAKDERGVFCLAIAVGYHKAGRSEQAIPWAEKAAAKLDQPIVHLTFGDILLSVAEGSGSAGRELFEKAVAQYDLVLKSQPDSIEAVNNKAWILHRHLDRNAEALDLATGLVDRADPSRLPAEFYDTLGAIQEAAGKVEDAERSFHEGLRKSPDHAILNYHMGRLLAVQPERVEAAKPYLMKALKSRDSLPGAMATDLDRLLAKVGR